ncbi:zinc finger protein 593 homolog [Phlebotomus papatasi]|uniref:Zinc finger protein 593 homolog n=1 Tax=Phlebotomus papatasi TaxID=29031 RepID=A0A1B0D6I5_PHLPP|nr:zinc finger protein 593 homolog [Phlebotomus papatasi]
MGKPQRRHKMHSGDTHLRRRWRTRSRKKDLDEIDEDLTKKSEELLNQEVDLEKPGFAQFYCIHCAKYFIDDNALQSHFKTKVHKRRLKALETEPYSVEESERAAGHGSFKEAKKRKLETQFKDPADGNRSKVLVLEAPKEEKMEK